MDTSRYKRRGIQTQRQTAETTFGNSAIVPRALSARPPAGQMMDFQRQPRPIGQHPKQPMDIIVSPNDKSPLAAGSSPTASTANSGSSKRPLAIGGQAIAAANATAPEATSINLQPAESPTAYKNYLPPIDMDLPGDNSPARNPRSLLARSKRQGIRLWAFRGAAIAMILVLVGGGLLFTQAYLKLHKVFDSGTASAAALKQNVNPSLLKGEGDGRINVLLLGRGGGNHDGPDLTDTLMLDSIDPVNHTSTLVSIPRDLWVDIPNAGAMKINAAWETGEFSYLGKISPGSTNRDAIEAGFNQADQVVESVLGVTIDYNALVDFQAFQQAVDTVGGVSVNVPTDLVDPTMAWENGNNPVLAKAGIQAFDGKQALNYVRSRETTSDFARAQRQRTVMLALKTKTSDLGTLSNPLKISGLLNAFGNNVQTDLSLKDATRLYSIVKATSDNKTVSVGLADAPNNYITTGTIAGQSIALPSAGLFNYAAIQTYMRGLLKDPYIVKENAKVLVLNGTNQPGLATNKANELKSYGYNVVATGNAPATDWGQTSLIDLSHGKDKYTKHYLEQRFNVTAATTLPDNTIQTNGADFVIILGSDEATPTKT